MFNIDFQFAAVCCCCCQICLEMIIIIKKIACSISVWVVEEKSNLKRATHNKHSCCHAQIQMKRTPMCRLKSRLKIEVNVIKRIVLRLKTVGECLFKKKKN